MPITPTYIPLATLTLTSTDSEIVFSSIPATYRDLIVVCATLGTAQASVFGRLNGDTGTGQYSTVRMFGTGSSTGSDVNGGADNITNKYLAGIINTTQTTQILQIMDYSATDKHKTILCRNASTVNSVNAHAARYASTSAITSVTVLVEGGSYAIGSTFSLFGIEA